MPSPWLLKVQNNLQLEDFGEILQNEDFGENKSSFEVNTYVCVDLFFHSKSPEYGRRKWPNWLYRK